MAEDLGERTEEPTPRRKREARLDGTIARSQDLAGAILLIAGTVVTWVAAGPMFTNGAVIFEAVLQWDTVVEPYDPDDSWALLGYVGSTGLQLAAPILLVTWTAAVLGHLLQVGFLFSPKLLQPKLSKLNPLSGFKRIFGISGLVKVTLDSLKLLAVVAVTVLTVYGYNSEILRLPYLTVGEATIEIGWMLLDLSLRILLLFLLLGILDFLYQQWKTNNDLKMTRQQVRDEMKDSEGDPETRRRRSRMQQEINNQRVSAAVPKADVVVTNPEHISVAIQYDADAMNAPIVVAKGADFLALRIRHIAARHNIPVVERKPLARALYRSVEPGQEVPPQFYKAVAEILAYVYRLSGREVA